MLTMQFDRDAMARWYAKQHLRTDPGIAAVHYLPTNAGEREIRFVEINNLIGERNDQTLEPIDFGIGMGSDTAHQLFVLDVTPGQWDRIQRKELALPSGWTLDGVVSFQDE